MTPIRPQFNTNLFAINALQNIAQQNGLTGMDSNIFGSNFSTMASLDTELSVFGALSQLQNQSFDCSSMPAFNFDFSSILSSFNFNFSSLSAGFRNPGVSLTSDKAKNALNLALSQVGVREIGSSNNSADINKYRNGVQNGAAWCASFVSWCYGRGQNNNNSKTFGYTASSQEIRIKAQKAGYYRKANTGYVPKAGDVVVWNNGDGTGHVGIVKSANADGSFQTVEGNCSNAVKEMRRNRNEVDGFVMMNEWLEA